MTTVGDDSGVLVTGATSGLGRAVALRFADQGIPVAVVGRSEEALRQVTAEVQARNARAVPLHADLSNTAALSELVDSAASQLGGIGVLVNAAGTDVPGRAEDLDLDEWNRVVAVNLTAPFALARSVMPRMRAGAAHAHMAPREARESPGRTVMAVGSPTAYVQTCRIRHRAP